jgi:hypothetical protein
MPNNSAESKARQRERNGNATRAGSSGMTKIVERMERKTYAELEDDLVHSVDIAGKITSLTTYANGSTGIQIVVPPAYAHEAMDALQGSRLMFTFVRVYHAPIPALLPPADPGDDTAAE